MASLTVHHLEKSRSHRVLWLLEELGVDYEVKQYFRHPETLRAGPELAEVHPLGKSPVITLEDGTVLAESGAMIDAILDRFGEGRMRPAPDSPQLQRYRYWLHFAEATLMPPLLVRLIFNRVRSAPLPFFVKPIAKAIAGKVDASYTDPEVHKLLSFVNAELEGREWLVDDGPTGADAQMLFPLQGALARGGDASRYPNVAAFVARVEARDAYKRALERGGPFEIL